MNEWYWYLFLKLWEISKIISSKKFLKTPWPHTQHKQITLIFFILNFPINRLFFLKYPKRIQNTLLFGSTWGVDMKYYHVVPELLRMSTQIETQMPISQHNILYISCTVLVQHNVGFCPCLTSTPIWNWEKMCSNTPSNKHGKEKPGGIRHPSKLTRNVIPSFIGCMQE